MKEDLEPETEVRAEQLMKELNESMHPRISIRADALLYDMVADARLQLLESV